MKIAAITDDGTTISQHFGRAGHYLVVTVTDGKISGRELRDKLSHSNFIQPGQEEEHHHGPEHGKDPESHTKHTQMAAAIQDCEALLCGGMGYGAYQSMQQIGVRPIITEIKSIDEAVLAYSKGEIVDRTDKLH